MSQYAYYLFNIVVGVPVLLLNRFGRLRISVSWRDALRAALLLFIPFIIWDIWATSAGHWRFNPHFVTAPRLFGLPIEEILFFLAVPFACYYTWAGIKKLYISTQLLPRWIVWLITSTVIVTGVLVFSLCPQHIYTRVAALVMVLVSGLLLYQNRLIRMRQFWVFQLIVLALFLIFNTYLTKLPILIYNPEAIIGFRVGTIPIEDFLFNFSLTSVLLLVLDKR